VDTSDSEKATTKFVSKQQDQCLVENADIGSAEWHANNVS
jgi:hypothetical protein